MDIYACVDGVLVKHDKAVVAVADQGFLYGFGLFETMLVLRGRPVLLSDHLERLQNSASELGLPYPGPERIRDMLAKTIRASRLWEGSLRLTLTAGPLPCAAGEEGAEPKVIITVKPGIPYPGELYRRGFTCGLLKDRRNENSLLVRLKTLNYLENILGRREAALSGWNEGVFVNNAGYLCEGTVSNLFIVKGGELITPSVESGLLPGTVRKAVMEMAGGKGIPVHERFVLPGELAEAEEAFFSNSLMGLMPLVAFNGRPVGGGRPGSLTQEMIKEYNRLILGNN